MRKRKSVFISRLFPFLMIVLLLMVGCSAAKTPAQDFLEKVYTTNLDRRYNALKKVQEASAPAAEKKPGAPAVQGAPLELEHRGFS